MNFFISKNKIFFSLIICFLLSFSSSFLFNFSTSECSIVHAQQVAPEVGESDANILPPLNSLLNNIVLIFIKITFGLTLLTGMIAFIIQLVKLNSYYSLPIHKEMAIRSLMSICISTGVASSVGLIFACIFYIISN